MDGSHLTELRRRIAERAGRSCVVDPCSPPTRSDALAPSEKRRSKRSSIPHPNKHGGQIMRHLLSTLALAATVTIASGARAQEIDWKKVDEAAGRTGAANQDVHRYGFPRTDLTVTVDGVT